MTGQPDNRAAWDAIAAAYQTKWWKDAPLDRFFWWWTGVVEDELHLLDEVQGKRVLVLGCGGGQDCIALVRMGAAEVMGIDLSEDQLRYARQLAAREGASVRFLQGNIEDLSAIASGTQDMVVSSQALTYVEHPERCFAETYRVVRPGNPFVFSVRHPFHVCLAEEPPYPVIKPYWQAEKDWDFEHPETGVKATLRSWYLTVSQWFRLLTEAGFQVERIVEPRPGKDVPWIIPGCADTDTLDKLKLIPGSIIFKARKPR
jgi:SAM-dependent methyltransferase